MDHATTPARLAYDEKTLDLPRIDAVEGNPGIGIGPLRKETGAVTYDPGFMNTANDAQIVEYTWVSYERGIRSYPTYQLLED